MGACVCVCVSACVCGAWVISGAIKSFSATPAECLTWATRRTREGTRGSGVRLPLSPPSFSFPHCFSRAFELTVTFGSPARDEFDSKRLDDPRAVDVRPACARGRGDRAHGVRKGLPFSSIFLLSSIFSQSHLFTDDPAPPPSLCHIHPTRTPLSPARTPRFARRPADWLHRPLPRQRHRFRLPLARHATRPRHQTHLLCRARAGGVRGPADARVPVHGVGEDGVEELEEGVWYVYAPPS